MVEKYYNYYVCKYLIISNIYERFFSLREMGRNSTEIGVKLYEERVDSRRVMYEVFLIFYKTY